MLLSNSSVAAKSRFKESLKSVEYPGADNHLNHLGHVTLIMSFIKIHYENWFFRITKLLVYVSSIRWCHSAVTVLRKIMRKVKTIKNLVINGWSITLNIGCTRLIPRENWLLHTKGHIRSRKYFLEVLQHLLPWTVKIPRALWTQT